MAEIDDDNVRLFTNGETTTHSSDHTANNDIIIDTNIIASNTIDDNIPESSSDAVQSINAESSASVTQISRFMPPQQQQQENGGFFNPPTRGLFILYIQKIFIV